MQHSGLASCSVLIPWLHVCCCESYVGVEEAVWLDYAGCLQFVSTCISPSTRSASWVTPGSWPDTNDKRCFDQRVLSVNNLELLKSDSKLADKYRFYTVVCVLYFPLCTTAAAQQQSSGRLGEKSTWTQDLWAATRAFNSWTLQSRRTLTPIAWA